MVKRKQVEGLPNGWYFTYDVKTKSRWAENALGARIPVKGVQEIRAGKYTIGQYLASYNITEGKSLPQAYINKYKHLVNSDTYHEYGNEGWITSTMSTLEDVHEYIESRLLPNNNSYELFIKAHGKSRGISSKAGEINWFSVSEYGDPGYLLSLIENGEITERLNELFEDVYSFAVEWRKL